MARWNERQHPRHPRGSGENSGRFRDKAGTDWAQRISDQIGRVVGVEAGLAAVAEIGTDRGDGTRTVTMQQLRAAGDLIQPGMLEIQTASGQWAPVESVQPWGHGVKVMYSAHNGQEVWEVARIKPAGAPVREFDSPAPRVGTPRGDGTYEATAAELLAHAAELEGRIQYHPRSDDGKRLLDPRPVLFITGHDRAVTIKGATNVGSMHLPDRPLVFSYLGEPTEAEQFFEMRLASGLESEESLEDLMAHSQRYEGKFEIFNPESGEWHVLQSAEYDQDELTEEDVIVVWVDEVGEEQRLQFPDDPRVKVRIRPIPAEDSRSQADKKLSEGWAGRLREMDPETVSESVRRHSPPPAAAPSGPVGPVSQMSLRDLADRLLEGETGWQYFWQVQEGDTEGIWVELGRVTPHRAVAGQAWLYGPTGLYLDQRSLNTDLFVRRAA